MNKEDWIALFRDRAESIFYELTGKTKKSRAGEINKRIKAIRDSQVEQLKMRAVHNSWGNDKPAYKAQGNSSY